jgi:hypothetical protein
MELGSSPLSRMVRDGRAMGIDRSTGGTQISPLTSAFEKERERVTGIEPALPAWKANQGGSTGVHPST